MPKTEDPLWWCGLYRVSISPQEQAAKQFGFFFPTRRQITPGLPIEVANNDDGSFSKPSGERALGFGFNQFCFGVRVADRTLSTATTAQLTSTFGPPTTPVQAITDGTSNTIIAILIGRR